MREALSNLIDNAVRYAGPASKVTLRAQVRAGQCVLEVEDNGPGLSATDRERMFERFWRASELPGGCGLGLSIVSEIAKRHGGQAYASGVEPQGLHIQLVLPLGA